MSSCKKYSLGFKQAAVKKFLNRGDRSVRELEKEIGTSNKNLYKWVKDFSNPNNEPKVSTQKINKKNSVEILQLVIKFESLADDSKGEFLRKNGIFVENIETWKNQIINALNQNLDNDNKKQLALKDSKIKDLETDLNRKDKALAEASALLILKKKADLLWGTEEK